MAMELDESLRNWHARENRVIGSSQELEGRCLEAWRQGLEFGFVPKQELEDRREEALRHGLEFGLLVSLVIYIFIAPVILWALWGWLI